MSTPTDSISPRELLEMRHQAFIEQMRELHFSKFMILKEFSRPNEIVSVFSNAPKEIDTNNQGVSSSTPRLITKET